VTTLLLDRTVWDSVLDANGNIALAGEPYSLAQDVASAVKLFIGELYYDTKQGIPYWTQVLGYLPPASLLTQLIETQALTVPLVVNANCTITSFNANVVAGQITFTDEDGVTTTINFTGGA
jgi:hypothetical protein